MSQHGANNRANAGYTYDDILAFYYPGTKLSQQYQLHGETTAYAPVNVQLNGYDFKNIPYTYKGDGVFVIEGCTVKAEAIKVDWYIQWNLLSPEKITSNEISGGFNFSYLP